MKNRLLWVAASCAGALATAAPASALPCIPTGAMQDGMPLTAQMVNPPAVTGTVDATGCDIGVYYGAGAGHTITDATIENARYYGVLTRNAGTSAAISTSHITRTGDAVGGMFIPTGAQHGVDVAFRFGATGSVDNSTIDQYQKGGVVVSNRDTDGVASAPTSATVTNSHVQGLGPVNFIAQNGVQYSSQASGLVRNNLIEDNEYTGSQNAFSTGLLLFDINPPDIKRSLNLYRDNDRNEIVIPSASLK